MDDSHIHGRWKGTGLLENKTCPIGQHALSVCKSLHRSWLYPIDEASSVRAVRLELGLLEFFIHGSGVVRGACLRVTALVAQQ